MKAKDVETNNTITANAEKVEAYKTALDEKDIYLGARPEVEQFAEVSKMYGGQDVILAHRVDRADSIYFIYGLRMDFYAINND